MFDRLIVRQRRYVRLIVRQRRYVMSKKPKAVCGRIAVMAVVLSLVAAAGLSGCDGQGVPAPGIGEEPSTNERGDLPSAKAPDTDKLTVSFDYEKQSGNSSNQFAVWLEDENGNFLSTLFVTEYIPQGGWEKRPGIPVWVEAAGLKKMSRKDIDAVSGATPKSGPLTYSYRGELKGPSGSVYSGDRFKVMIEGTLRWENRVEYSCIVDKNTSIVSDEKTEYISKASDEGEALGEDAEERGMLTNFRVEYQRADT
jgi:hypothetical protein